MLLLLIAACTSAPVPTVASPASWEDLGDPVSIELLGGVGTGTVELWGRRRTAEGITVSGPPIEIVLDGRPETLSLSADGYGRTTLSSVGLHTATAEGMAVELTVHPTEWLGFELERAWWPPGVVDGDFSHGGGGGLARMEGRLRWFSSEGHLHDVLAPELPVLGVVSGHLDADGIGDAVAWTAESVYLLRGRPDGGGMSGIGKIVGSGQPVVGVALGDPNDDGFTDVAVVWGGGRTAGQLDVWEGDGQFSYTPASNRYLQTAPVSLSIGSSTDGGPDQITVITEDRNWERYYAYKGRYSRAGPSLVLDLPTGGALSVDDMLGDGADEILVFDAYVRGEARDIQVVDLEGDARVLTLERGPSFFSVQDLDGDEHADLLFSGDDGSIRWTHLNGDGRSLTTTRLVGDGNGVGGPIVEMRLDGQIVVAGERSWRWYTRDPNSEEMALSDVRFDNVGLVPRGGVFDLLEQRSGALMVGLADQVSLLQIWEELDGGGIAITGAVGLRADSVSLRDLVVCGTDGWVLLEDELVHVDLGDPSAPVVTGRTPAVGSNVSCGAGPNSVVGVLEEDRIRLFDAEIAEVAVELHPGAVDFVMGGGRVASCTSEGCSVALGPFGEQGAWVEVISTPTSTKVDGVSLVGIGVPTVFDVDADGQLDLLLHDDGQIVLHRWKTTSFSPPEVWFTPQHLFGPLRFGDRDGDGNVEAWAIQSSTGRVHATHPTPPPTAHTGETGTPAQTGDPVGGGGGATATGDTGR